MATRKICVEQYNEVQSGVREVIDPIYLEVQKVSHL